MALEEGRLTRPDRPVSRAPSAGSLADLRPWRDHLPSGDGRPASSLTSAGTLVAAWLSRCASAPAQPLWLEGDGERSGCCTNEQFEEDTRRMAGRLLHAGLEPGDRVLWSCQASIAALVANVACLRAGLVVVPASTADTEPEVASVVRLTRPRAAVVDDDARARWVRRAAGPSTIVVGPSVDLPGSPASESSIDRSRPEDPALVGLTSGSTGAPKGAALSHGNLLAGAEALRWAWRWEADDRLLHCLPLFHAHGLCVGVYGTMVAGASAVLLGRFDPERVAAAARDDRATLFFGVPTMYRRLLGSGRAPDLRGLRLCVSGSAPLEPDLHAEASAAIGAPVLERYGMTEALMVTSNPCEGERRPGTVGFPLPG
ncbi:MAG TPA: AMP-binding protein, partial [Acidimicrobiales bacterium]|nr:AMP-binding protein [Acidimicrobiales bacterium]